MCDMQDEGCVLIPQKKWSQSCFPFRHEKVATGLAAEQVRM
jgi:hypothetical protein